MTPAVRRRWDWRSIRGLGSRRVAARPGRSPIERLEPRFLLAGAGTSQVDSALPVSAGLPDQSVVSSPIDAGPVIEPGTTDPSTTPVPTGRVDSYTLPAGTDGPEVQVELDWSGGANPADGQLVLLDASGASIFETSLVGVVELHTSIKVPSDQPGVPSTSSLGIDLTISRADDGSDQPGTFRLTLTWRSGLIATEPAGVVDPTPVSSHPAAVTAPPAVVPGLDITGLLPAAGDVPAGSVVLAPPAIETSTPTTAAPAGPGVTLPVGGPTIEANPGLPAPAVALPSTTATAPSNAGNHASSGSGGASAPSDRDRSTFVGPLPFGTSFPDGGIFERSFASTASTREGNEGARPATAPLASPVARSVPTDTDGWVQESPGSSGRRRGRSGRLPGLPELAWPAGSRVDGEDRSVVGMSSIGSAFLPPISGLSSFERRTEPVRKDELPRARPRGGLRGNPVVAVIVALTSSAAMLLALGGLERVRGSRLALDGRSPDDRAT